MLDSRHPFSCVENGRLVRGGIDRVTTAMSGNLRIAEFVVVGDGGGRQVHASGLKD